MSRHVWTPHDTSDTSGPDALLRAYLEQRDVRRCLRDASTLRPIATACDVGCGYGRLTPVLAEFAREVTGFEREGHLVAEATRLQPGLRFASVESLSRLPAGDGAFDFAMTFTVLQHLGDSEARDVIAEIQRVAGGGGILLVEETDPALCDGDRQRPERGLTVGRSVETYVEWMSPRPLVRRFPREIEPGYARRDVGTYMLFGPPRVSRA